MLPRENKYVTKEPSPCHVIVIDVGGVEIIQSKYILETIFEGF